MVTQAKAIPSAFIWRRVHSLMGFAIVVYLVEHLTTNALAALWIGQDGIGFIKVVNFIHSLPFLKLLEIGLIGIPLLFHAVVGIKYAISAKSNVRDKGGSSPTLKYERNRAYSLQRLSSWVLLLGIILHVVQMRFLDVPKEVRVQSKKFFLARVTMDEGLYTLAPRLGVSLYSEAKIDSLAQQTSNSKSMPTVSIGQATESYPFNEKTALIREQKQQGFEKEKLSRGLSSYSLDKNQVVAVCPDSGTAFLLNIRNTFKSYWMIGFYTIFVLAAAFHGFNGLWTFLITWGAILSYRSQKKMVNVCYGLMFVMIFFGLSSVWGTYWINLRY